MILGKHSQNCQSGRSMLEMIGVLGIVCILSMQGFSAYSHAMEKIAVNESLLQLNSIVRNIYELYHSQHSYRGLDNKTMIDSNAVPRNMVVSNNELRNLFGGDVKMRAVSYGKGFVIVYNGLPSTVCTQMASAPHEFERIGLQYLMISPSGYHLPRNFPSTLDNGEYSVSELPIKVSQAAKDCNCRQSNCGIALFFQ